MEDNKALIQSFPALRERLSSAALEEIIQKAKATNPWFTSEFIKQAVDSIANKFLNEQNCQDWLATYPNENDNAKKVAVIMAGNLPLVGFHDLLCVLMSGNEAIIKLSDKDSVLLPWLTDQWADILPTVSSLVTYTTRLEKFDAVIATGSNNSSRYFDFYFKKYPHILRRNRNGVAVLTGNESIADLKMLSKDIFQYYGLGCRSVSKIYVPEGYDFSQWEEAVADWQYLADHHKYKNNLEYNFALYIINSIPHLNLGNIILKEDDAIASRIGTLNYSHYKSLPSLVDELLTKKDEIQCVVSGSHIEGWDHIPYGSSQLPKLNQYADGVDTMAFLTKL